MIKIINYDDIYNLRDKYKKIEISEHMTKINFVFMKNQSKDNKSNIFKNKLSNIKKF